MTRRAATVLSDKAVAATKRYLLVDLSDTTNYPHSAGDWIELLGLDIQLNQAGAGQWDMKVGLVTENDATNGSVYWFAVYILSAAGAIAKTLAFTDPKTGTGLPMKITSDKPENWVTNDSDLASANWDNAVANLTDPLGNANKSPGAGDLVMELTEVSGTTTIDISIRTEYRTREN